MTNEELLEQVQEQLAVMIDTATGRTRIEDVNDAYKARRERIRSGLTERGVRDPNPYLDLWRYLIRSSDT